jgi:hypothetical protein
MSFVSRIASVMNFSQRSLENTMTTIKEVHQTIFEIPVNVAEDLGLPREQAVDLKNKHRQILDHLHDGIVDACGEVNQYVVNQAQAVNDFARDQWEPPRQTVVDLETKRAQSKQTLG